MLGEEINVANHTVKKTKGEEEHDGILIGELQLPCFLIDITKQEGHININSYAKSEVFNYE